MLKKYQPKVARSNYLPRFKGQVKGVDCPMLNGNHYYWGNPDGTPDFDMGGLSPAEIEAAFARATVDAYNPHSGSAVPWREMGARPVD